MTNEQLKALYEKYTEMSKDRSHTAGWRFAFQEAADMLSDAMRAPDLYVINLSEKVPRTD